MFYDNKDGTLQKQLWEIGSVCELGCSKGKKRSNVVKNGKFPAFQI